MLKGKRNAMDVSGEGWNVTRKRTDRHVAQPKTHAIRKRPCGSIIVVCIAIASVIGVCRSPTIAHTDRHRCGHVDVTVPTPKQSYES